MRANVLLCYIILSILQISSGFDRKIESHINPGCETCNNENITLMYVISTGDKDIIHNIWDFTSGKPSIICALTGVNDKLDFNWENNKAKSVNFTNAPLYSFGVVIDKIWEFNDLNNTATFDPDNKKQTKSFDTKGMKWMRDLNIQTEQETAIKMVAHTFGVGADKRKGQITLKLDIYSYTDYAFELPHLIHTANSTLIDVIFNDMTSTKEFNNSRFSLELVFISTENVNLNDSIKINVRKGLDDEHTPGTFEIVDIVTPEAAHKGDGGFVQFRPISYTHPVKDVASSIEVHTGWLSPAQLDNDTLTYSLFNQLKDFHILVERVIISMGTKGDGFFEKTHYTIWSFTMGYGSPPLEGFSLMVILIISIGLGIPFLLMIFGGIYICIKRRNRMNNEPEVLIEDTIS